MPIYPGAEGIKVDKVEEIKTTNISRISISITNDLKIITKTRNSNNHVVRVNKITLNNEILKFFNQVISCWILVPNFKNFITA